MGRASACNPECTNCGTKIPEGNEYCPSCKLTPAEAKQIANEHEEERNNIHASVLRIKTRNQKQQEQYRGNIDRSHNSPMQDWAETSEDFIIMAEITDGIIKTQLNLCITPINSTSLNLIADTVEGEAYFEIRHTMIERINLKDYSGANKLYDKLTNKNEVITLNDIARWKP
jgi:uncharacterized protein YukE